MDLEIVFTQTQNQTEVKPLERTNEIVEVQKKKVKYSPAHLKAQNKYREKNREKYNESQRQLYEKKKQEDEWKQHYLERSRVNNRKYREKKKQEQIDSGVYVEKKRGRPRKVLGCIFEDVELETRDIKDEYSGYEVHNASQYFSEGNCIKITDEEREKIDEMIAKIRLN
jgi:hypothetical protein